MAVHRAAAHARLLGDRADAGVFVIGERSARRVDDLRAIQRCVAALAPFRSLLADSSGVLILIPKWNTLTHISGSCILKVSFHCVMLQIRGIFAVECSLTEPYLEQLVSVH